MRKKIINLKTVLLTLAIGLAFTGCISYQDVTPSRKVVTTYNYVSNVPSWGPSYYQGSRYYYFPDIQTYYDLSTRQFIVLNMGSWYYVSSIIPYYPSFDLYRSYIVVLNVNVYQPWMHHHHYITNYPAYYYIDYYDYSYIPYVRGYNENIKGAMYWSNSERSKARPWDGRNLVNSRQFNYSSSDRAVQQTTTRDVNAGRLTPTTGRGAVTTGRTPATTDRATTTTTDRTSTTVTDRNVNTNDRTSASTNRGTTTTTDRTTATTNRGTTTTTDRTSATVQTRDNNIQSSTATRGTEQTVERRSSTNYYGNSIGSPVRVEPQMRRATTTTETNTRSTRDTGSTNTQRNTTTRGTGR